VVTEADFLSTINIKGNKALKNLFNTIIRRRRKRKSMGTEVDDIMTKNPVTAKEDDSLQRAIELMDRNNIKRLIITDSKKHVKGVVSRPDLVHLFLLKH
jgi:sulfide:quinone oxidoreductase